MNATAHVAQPTSQSDVSDVHQTTTTPVGARYELVQSEVAAKWTFRLDRFTGKVDLIVRTTSGENAWESMIVQDLPKIARPNKPRFLLYYLRHHSQTHVSDGHSHGKNLGRDSG